MAGKNYLIAFAGILKLLTQSSFSCNVTKEMEGGNSSFKTYYLVTIVISTVIFEPEIISKSEGVVTGISNLSLLVSLLP